MQPRASMRRDFHRMQRQHVHAVRGVLQGTSHDFLQCETSAAANESYVLEGKCTPLVTSERTASSIHNGGIQHTATVSAQPRELDNAMPSLTECPLADESVARLNVRRDEVCLVADRISSDAGEEMSAVRRCGRTPRPWVDNKASTPATPSSMTRRQQPSACASPPLLRRRRPSSCSCKLQLQPCWPARVANTALMAASASQECRGRKNAPWELVSRCRPALRVSK